LGSKSDEWGGVGFKAGMGKIHQGDIQTCYSIIYNYLTICYHNGMNKKYWKRLKQQFALSTAASYE